MGTRHQQKTGMKYLITLLAALGGGAFGCSKSGGDAGVPPASPSGGEDGDQQRQLSLIKTPEGQVNVGEDVTFSGDFDSVDLDARVDSDGDGGLTNDPDAALGETVTYSTGGIYVATAHLGSEKVEERIVVKPYAIFTLVEQVDQFPYSVDLISDDAWGYILAAIPDQSFADELRQLDLVKGSSDSIRARALVSDGTRSGLVYHVKYGAGRTVGFPNDEALCEQPLSGTLLAYLVGNMLDETQGIDTVQQAVPSNATVSLSSPLTIAPFSFTPDVTIERTFSSGSTSIVGVYYGSPQNPVDPAELAKVQALQSVQQGQYHPFTVIAIPETGSGGATRFEILGTLGQRFVQDDLNN